MRQNGRRELCLICAPIIWLWERHANCDRLLELFYILDRMLLFFDGSEWEPAADINVCCYNVCVCVFLVGKTWPQFLTSKPLSVFFFFLPSSSSSLCFVYSPWSSPTPPFLSTLPQTHSDLAAVCAPAAYRCVYHPSICLYFLQRELVLFGEAKENSDVEDTPHQQPRWITELSYGTKRRHSCKM